MTTVAVKRNDKGEIEIAADRQITANKQKMLMSKPKFFKKNNMVLAGAGTLEDLQKLRYSKLPAIKPGEDTEGFLVARFCPAVNEVLKNEEREVDLDLLIIINNRIFEVLGGVVEFQNHAALGSGAEFAIGAMSGGADVITAVTIASNIDVYSGGMIDASNVNDILEEDYNLENYTESEEKLTEGENQ